MNRRRLQLLAAVALAALLMASAAAVQAARERAFPLPEPDDTSLYLTSGAAIRRLTASLNSLTADVYWIRTLQYYGAANRRLTPDPLRPEPPPLLALQSDYDQLYALLDLTTTLDPRFTIAYRFGAVFLAEAYPAGPGRPDLAVKLLEKGIREQPDKWEYMEDLGFVHFWYDRDFKEAARWFQRASEVPMAPPWLAPLAASTLAQGGDRQSARLMWTHILESADLDWLKHQAEFRLLQLRAMDDIDALQRSVDGYSRRAGHAPAGWQELAATGALRGIPVDPAGERYELTSDGHVTLSASSPLSPLPASEPPRLGPS